MDQESTQPKPQEKITPAFFADLPEEARNNLSDEWNVSAELPADRQIGRAINRAEDALAGIVSEGVDKKRTRAEAGRVLSHIRQELADEEFMPEMDPKQREYLKSEADRLWAEGGQEANESWKNLTVQGQDPTVKGEPAESGSERILGRLSEMTGSIQKIYDVSARSLDGAIDFVKTNFPDETGRIQALEITKKIITTRLNPTITAQQMAESITAAREAIKHVGGEQYTRADSEKAILSSARDKYAKLLQVSVVNALNGLDRSARSEENSQIKTVIESAHRDIEKMVSLTGGIHRIEVEEGTAVDFRTMEPTDIVPTNDAKYKGAEIIASVEENGYEFDQDLQLFEGQGRDVVSPAKVEVYKYQE
jgi:hypothetical protein